MSQSVDICLYKLYGGATLAMSMLFMMVQRMRPRFDVAVDDGNEDILTNTRNGHP